jgi:hypothetical protein
VFEKRNMYLKKLNRFFQNRTIINSKQLLKLKHTFEKLKHTFETWIINLLRAIWKIWKIWKAVRKQFQSKAMTAHKLKTYLGIGLK